MMLTEFLMKSNTFTFISKGFRKPLLLQYNHGSNCELRKERSCMVYCTEKMNMLLFEQ